MDPFIIFVNLSGIAICIIVFILYKKKHIEKFTWVLFCIGIILGLCWEAPMCIIPAPFPTPFSVIAIMITASIWDGGLFLLGYWFVKIICKEPHFDKFNWKELVVLLFYGQASSFIVEMIAVASGGWEYEVTTWNPLLFKFFGGNITLLPQLIWFVAPIVFYLIALKLKPKFITC